MIASAATEERVYEVSASYIADLWSRAVDPVLDSINYHKLYVSAYESSGATVDPLTLDPADHADRYIASYAGGEVIGSAFGYPANYWEFVGSLKRAREQAVKHGGKVYLGVWVAWDTASIYIDVSRSFADKRTALRFAERNNQLSIYDSKTDTVIWLEGQE
jgi:hypothetical protein